MSTLLSSKLVKTKREHICFGCGRKFDKDTNMIRSSFADNGTAFTTYLCQSCEKYCHDNFDYGDEFSFGELKDGVLEMEGNNG
jgi:hypothetical protein